MKTAPTHHRAGLADIACLLVLGTAAIKLLLLDASQHEQYVATAERHDTKPAMGSMTAFDPSGKLIQSAASSTTVVFVLHASSVAGDLAFWHEVARQVSAPLVRYWGVCDVRTACDAEHGTPTTVVGFMDPFEMRAVANADRSSEALVYRDSYLTASVHVDDNPVTLAQAIKRLIH